MMHAGHPQHPPAPPQPLPPCQTLYLNNLNEKVKIEGKILV